MTVKQLVVGVALLTLLIGWTPRPPALGGTLKIENRTKSEVTVNEVNGGYCCTTDKGDYCSCALSPGTHKLSVKCNDSGNRFERTVEIKDGEAAYLLLDSGC